MTEEQELSKTRYAPVDTIARLLNLTPRRVQQLAKEGHFPQSRRGHYEVVPTVQGYCRYMQGIVGGVDDEHRSVQTEIAKQRAERLARENALARGELIPRGHMITGMQTAISHCRSKLLSIPSKAAPAVAAIDDVAAIKEHLTELVHDALEELSRTRFVAVKPADQDGQKTVRRKGRKAASRRRTSSSGAAHD
jgi:hypothetical protein